MPGPYRVYAEAGMAALMGWYDPARGLWQTGGWWNAANALAVVIAYTMRTRAPTYQSAIATTFEKNKGWALCRAGQWFYPGRFINHYYDDEGWWALTWITAYDLTGEQRYLNMARTIFADMTRGWDTRCGGGLMWKKWDGPRWVPYKNAITNELFLTLAARLYQRTSLERYRTWALQAWTWFEASHLLNAQHLINDGLDRSCRNNGRPTWTYNQGVILGGLVDLARITQDVSYQALAHAIAAAALSTLVDASGILTEPGEAQAPSSDADLPQFKGIFMRHLAYLDAADPRPAYREFIIRNADSIWHKNRTVANQFGLHWAGPVDRTDAIRQTAALDALLAALPFATSCHLASSG